MNRVLSLVSVLLFIAAAAYAADNLSRGSDGQSIRTTESGNVHTLHAVPSVGGAAVSASNPLFVVYDVGAASSGTESQIVDTSKNITADLLKNKKIAVTISGVTYYRNISTNSSNTFEFGETLPVAPTNGTVYRLLFW